MFRSNICERSAGRKATELAKGARKEGERFESATWVHKAQMLPKEEFKREVERHLTGKETEAWEIVYFKLYKSQLPVVEKATRNCQPDAWNR